MDESDERDRLQQDIQQIHQVLSADEGGSSDDDDDDVDILDDGYTPGGDLQIVETSVTNENGIEQGADEDDFEEEQDQPPIQSLLDRNRHYQDLIETLLHQVQQALENNRIEQKEVETRMLAAGGQNYDGLPISKRPAAKAMVSFFKPYFRDESGHVPPPNTEAKERKTMVQQDPFLIPRSAWSKHEIKSLKEGVRNDRLRRIQQPMWNRRELLQDKLSNPRLDPEERDNLQDEIEALDDSITRSSEGPDSNADGLCHTGIDWMRISSMDLEGDRSPLECKLQWQVLQNPDINNTKWTASEEDKLVHLAKKHQERDWVTIASKLGTGRTAFQCIQHYRMNLCNNLCKKYFSPEEDKKMMELVEKFRVGNYIPYTKVAYYMDGHSHKQVSMHWLATLNPSIRTGKWSKEEDELLRQAVACYGANKNWAKVAEGVPGRTFMQVRDRWCFRINPNVKRGSWGPKEDLRMIELIIKHGLGNWRKVATDMAEGEDNCSRTCNSLLIRFRNMVKKLNKTRKKKSKTSAADKDEDKDIDEDLPTDKLLQLLKEQKQWECEVFGEDHKVKVKRNRGQTRKKTVEDASIEDNIIELLKPTTHDGVGKKPKAIKKSKHKAKQSRNNKAAYAMLLKVYDVKVKEESRMVQNMMGVKTYVQPLPKSRSKPQKSATAGQAAPVLPLRALSNVTSDNTRLSTSAPSSTSQALLSTSVECTSTSQTQPFQMPATHLLQQMINKEQVSSDSATNQVIMVKQTIQETTLISSDVFQPPNTPSVPCPTATSSGALSPAKAPSDTDVDMESVGSADDVGMPSLDSDHEETTEPGTPVAAARDVLIPKEGASSEGVGHLQLTTSSTNAATPVQLLMPSTPRIQENQTMQSTLQQIRKDSIIAATPSVPAPLQKPYTTAISNASQMVPSSLKTATSIVNTPISQVRLSTSLARPPVPIALHMASAQQATPQRSSIPVKQLIQASRQKQQLSTMQAIANSTNMSSTVTPSTSRLTQSSTATPSTNIQMQQSPVQTIPNTLSTSAVCTPNRKTQQSSLQTITTSSTTGQPYPTSLQVANTPPVPSTAQGNPLLSQLASVIQQGGQLQPISNPVGAIQANTLGNMATNQLQQNMIVVGSAPVVPIFIPGFGNVFGFLPGSMQLTAAGLTNNQLSNNSQVPGNAQVGTPAQSAMGAQSIMANTQPVMPQMMGMFPGMGMMGMLPGMGMMGMAAGIGNPQQMMSMMTPGTSNTQAGSIPMQLPVTAALPVSQGVTSMSPGLPVSPAQQQGVTSMSPGLAVSQAQGSLAQGVTSMSPGLAVSQAQGSLAQGVTPMSPGLAVSQAQGSLAQGVKPMSPGLALSSAQGSLAQGVTVTGMSPGMKVTPEQQGVTGMSPGLALSPSEGSLSQGVTSKSPGLAVSSAQGSLAQGVTVTGMSPGLTVSPEQQGVTGMSPGLALSPSEGSLSQGVTAKSPGLAVSSAQGSLAQGVTVTGMSPGLTVSPKQQGVTGMSPGLALSPSQGSLSQGVTANSPAQQGSLAPLQIDMTPGLGVATAPLPAQQKSVAQGVTSVSPGLGVAPSQQVATMHGVTNVAPEMEIVPTQLHKSTAQEVSSVSPALEVAPAKQVSPNLGLTSESTVLGAAMEQQDSISQEETDTFTGSDIESPQQIHTEEVVTSESPGLDMQLTKVGPVPQRATEPSVGLDASPVQQDRMYQEVTEVSPRLGATPNSEPDNVIPQKGDNSLSNIEIIYADSTLSKAKMQSSSNVNSQTSKKKKTKATSKPSLSSVLPSLNEGASNNGLSSILPSLNDTIDFADGSVRKSKSAVPSKSNSQNLDSLPQQRNDVNVWTSTELPASKKQTSTEEQLQSTYQSSVHQPLTSVASVTIQTGGTGEQPSPNLHPVSSMNPTTSVLSHTDKLPGSSIHPVGQSTTHVLAHTDKLPGTGVHPAVKQTTYVLSHAVKPPGTCLHPIPSVRPVVRVLPTTNVQQVTHTVPPVIEIQSSTATTVVTTTPSQLGANPALPIPIVNPNPVPQQRVKILKPGQTTGISARLPRPRLPVGNIIRNGMSQVPTTGITVRQQVRMLRPVVGIRPPSRGKRMPSQSVDKSASSPNTTTPTLPAPPPIQRLSHQITVPSTSNIQRLSHQTIGPSTSNSQRLSHQTIGPSTSNIQRLSHQTIGPSTSNSLRLSHQTIFPSTSNIEYRLNPIMENTMGGDGVNNRQMALRLQVQASTIAEVNQMAENLLGTDASEKTIPLLPPNCATLTALKTLLLHRKTLEKRANDYTGQPEKETLTKKYKGYMASRLPQEEDPSQLTVHTNDGSRVSQCSNTGEQHPLVHILDTRDFKRLQERFMSVFAWPALLSTIPPRKKSKLKGKKKSKSLAESKVDSEQIAKKFARKRSSGDMDVLAVASDEPAAKLAKPSDAPRDGL